MRKILLGLLPVVLLAGCQTSVEKADNKADRLWEAAAPYAQCVVTRADQIAMEPEDPYYLYVAAKTSCADKWADVSDAISRIYRVSQWSQITAIVERKVREAAITRVVNHRAKVG